MIIAQKWTKINSISEFKPVNAPVIDGGWNFSEYK